MAHMTDEALFEAAEQAGTFKRYPRAAWAVGTLVRPLMCKRRMLLPKGTRVLLTQDTLLYWIAFNPQLIGWTFGDTTGIAVCSPAIVSGGKGWARTTTAAHRSHP